MTDSLPVFSVDLRRAARRSEGETRDWSEQRLSHAVERYRRFFALARQPGPVAPTRDIDRIWHLHMLSPVAYQRDCMGYLGRILDHDGGFGSDPAEVAELGETFARTAARWRQAYSEDYADGSGSQKCWHDCQGRCWHACKEAHDDLGDGVRAVP